MLNKNLQTVGTNCKKPDKPWKLLPEQKQVLVAEDSLDFIHLIRFEAQNLASEWRFHFVSFGSEAVNQCRNFLYDVVILDISLPDCSGYQVARELKQMGFTAPILAFSLVPSVSFFRNQQAFLFDGLLKKPFECADFLANFEKFKRPAARPPGHGFPL